ARFLMPKLCVPLMWKPAGATSKHPLLHKQYPHGKSPVKWPGFLLSKIEIPVPKQGGIDVRAIPAISARFGSRSHAPRGNEAADLSLFHFCFCPPKIEETHEYSRKNCQ